MFKSTKRLLEILKDESGMGLPLIAAGVIGGGALMKGLLGKNKEKTIDPYAGLRGDYQSYLQKKLGTSTPYSYNEDFTLDQPNIEKQTEGVISGKLGNLPKIQSDIYDIGTKYYNAQKAQMTERHGEEAKANQNMYNRLGLVSSTPGLQAQTDLGRKQGQEFNVLEADVARQGIDQEMKALALGEDIANQYLTQGQQLGNLQRGYQRDSMTMSMADIERMVNEEQGYAQLAGGLLEDNPPETYFQPNFWSQLGDAAMSGGTTALTAGMLGGGGGGTEGTVGNTGKTQSQILGRSTARYR